MSPGAASADQVDVVGRVHAYAPVLGQRGDDVAAGQFRPYLAVVVEDVPLEGDRVDIVARAAADVAYVEIVPVGGILRKQGRAPILTVVMQHVVVVADGEDVAQRAAPDAVDLPVDARGHGCPARAVVVQDDAPLAADEDVVLADTPHEFQIRAGPDEGAFPGRAVVMQQQPVVADRVDSVGVAGPDIVEEIEAHRLQFPIGVFGRGGGIRADSVVSAGDYDQQRHDRTE